MLIKSDVYGVYEMNGVFCGELLGVYDVDEPGEALDAYAVEAGLDPYFFENYAIKEAEEMDDFYPDMPDDEYNYLVDSVYERYCVKHMKGE